MDTIYVSTSSGLSDISVVVQALAAIAVGFLTYRLWRTTQQYTKVTEVISKANASLVKETRQMVEQNAGMLAIMRESLKPEMGIRCFRLYHQKNFYLVCLSVENNSKSTIYNVDAKLLQNDGESVPNCDFVHKSDVGSGLKKVMYLEITEFTALIKIGHIMEVFVEYKYRGLEYKETHKVIVGENLLPKLECLKIGDRWDKDIREGI